MLLLLLVFSSLLIPYSSYFSDIAEAKQDTSQHPEIQLSKSQST